MKPTVLLAFLLPCWLSSVTTEARDTEVLAPEEEETLRVDIVPKAINVNREDELTLHCRVTPEPILPCVFLWTLKNKEAAFELLSIPGLVEIILKDGIETDLTVFKVTEFYTGTYTCKAFCLEDAPFATATINFYGYHPTTRVVMTVILIALGVLVVLTGGLIGLMYWRRYKAKKQEQESQEPVATYQASGGEGEVNIAFESDDTGENSSTYQIGRASGTSDQTRRQSRDVGDISRELEISREDCRDVEVESAFVNSIPASEEALPLPSYEEALHHGTLESTITASAIGTDFQQLSASHLYGLYRHSAELAPTEQTMQIDRSTIADQPSSYQPASLQERHPRSQRTIIYANRQLHRRPFNRQRRLRYHSTGSHPSDSDSREMTARSDVTSLSRGERNNTNCAGSPREERRHSLPDSALSVPAEV